LQTLKPQLDGEKQNFSNLFNSISPYLVPGTDYCLLSAPWLARWRSYLSQGHKLNGAERPASLSLAQEELLCSNGNHSHPQAHLAFAPPLAQKKYAPPTHTF